MNLDLIGTAVLPVFFVLVLGYAAGRYHSFSTDQATGFNQLATNFAMPASLFVDMLQLQRQLLLQQGPLLLLVVVVHIGLFGTVCLLLRGRFGLSFTAVILLALSIASSSTAVYGAVVLKPVAGAGSAGAVGLVALVTNLLVPIALFMLQKSHSATPAAPASPPPAGPAAASPAGAAPAAPANPPVPPAPANPPAPPAPANPPATSVGAALRSALTSPLLLAPLLGVVLVLLAVRLPAVLLGPLELLGQATTSVAVFAVGLTLAAHRLNFSRLVLVSALARVVVQSALLLGLVLAFHVRGELARATIMCCSLPVGVLQVLLASRFGALEKELPSILLLTTVAMVAALPAWFALTGWLLPH